MSIDLEKRISSFEELLEIIKNSNITHDIALVKKAYDFASRVHSGHLRISGETYIKHCLNVAKLVASLNLDSVSIACALLHDSVEEDKISVDEIDREFGTEISFIINSLTSIKSFTNRYIDQDEALPQNIRDLILNSTDDVRVLIVRLAEKIDNLSTIENLPIDQQVRSAQKILNIYGPLCEYLGLGAFKRYLEDNAFKVLNYEEYRITTEAIKEIIGQRQYKIDKFRNELEKVLHRSGIELIKIQTRIKGIYSTYRKVKSKYTPKGEKVSLEGFKRLNDLLAARVIVSTVEECYSVLGIIHSNWEYKPKEFVDYIMKPKGNGYKSIQTAIKYEDIVLEVQIRTQEMHEYNEYGPASHIAYKLSGGKSTRFKGESMTWTKELVKWQEESEIKKDIYKIKVLANSVFVFTPKGKLIKLPKGSTPIDFAFKIHLEIGLKYNGALVNGKIVNKDYKLKTGDTVQILQGHKIAVSDDWLNIVKTGSARQKIRKHLKLLKKIN